MDALEVQPPVVPLTTNMVLVDKLGLIVAVVAPELQVNVFAPNAEMVAVVPAQTSDGVILMLMVGDGKKFTVNCLDTAHAAFDPVTV